MEAAAALAGHQVVAVDPADGPRAVAVAVVAGIVDRAKQHKTSLTMRTKPNKHLHFCMLHLIWPDINQSIKFGIF